MSRRKIFNCDICGIEIVGKKTNFLRHRALHEPVVQRIQCNTDDCGQTFSTLYNFQVHVSRKHESVENVHAKWIMQNSRERIRRADEPYQPPEPDESLCHSDLDSNTINEVTIDNGMAETTQPFDSNGSKSCGRSVFEDPTKTESSKSDSAPKSSENSKFSTRASAKHVRYSTRSITKNGHQGSPPISTEFVDSASPVHQNGPGNVSFEEMDYAQDFQNANDDDGENSNTEIPGSVVIKNEAGDSVSHAKIIGKVLTKHPFQVTNKKSIKSKIEEARNTPVTESIITKEPSTIAISKQQTAKSEVTGKVGKTASAPAAKPIISKHSKKIDIRTMRALIAKGAENVTGPWLCLECGVDGRPISIPSYKSFRRHLIKVHKEKIDPRLCEHCGHRSAKRNDLHYHILTKHNIEPPNDLQFPKCGQCTFIALDQIALRKHKEDHHAQCQQYCIYCNKTFHKEIELYTHMRDDHALFQEDEEMEFLEEGSYENDIGSGIATSLVVLDRNAHLEGNESYEEDLQWKHIEAAVADVHGEETPETDSSDKSMLAICSASVSRATFVFEQPANVEHTNTPRIERGKNEPSFDDFAKVQLSFPSTPFLLGASSSVDADVNYSNRSFTQYREKTLEATTMLPDKVNTKATNHNVLSGGDSIDLSDPWLFRQKTRVPKDLSTLSYSWFLRKPKCVRSQQPLLQQKQIRPAKTITIQPAKLTPKPNDYLLKSVTDDKQICTPNYSELYHEVTFETGKNIPHKKNNPKLQAFLIAAISKMRKSGTH